MHIYISRNVRIVATGDRDYVIHQRVKSPGTKSDNTWKNRGYYGRLDHAAQAVLEKELCETAGNINIRQLLEVLQQAAERIEAVCAAVRPVLATHPNLPELHVPPEPEDLVVAS